MMTALFRKSDMPKHKSCTYRFLFPDISKAALQLRLCKCVSQLTAPAKLCKTSRQAFIDVKVLPPPQ